MYLNSYGVHRWFDLAARFSAFVQRLIFGIAMAFRDSRFVIQASGKWRRFFLIHFRPGYVKRQLAARQGDCHQCGTCCNLVFTCPMLSRQGRCFVYGRCRPQVCKVFPIDQQDLDEIRMCGGRCGYGFLEWMKDEG